MVKIKASAIHLGCGTRAGKHSEALALLIWNSQNRKAVVLAKQDNGFFVTNFVVKQ